MGLILLEENMFMIFAMITPDAVPNEKTKRPSTIMPSVSRLRNLSADNLLPTSRPRKIVTILMSECCVVSLKRLTTPAFSHKISEHQEAEEKILGQAKQFQKQRLL
ncbi:MAG: hypothetical protein SCARUB_02304 [Candidatus Scalindua rubra]|uniref:Uncharacterized protein n=1 Tax=Candidatus Scalindua rubra TaxID=1872076 RepID=A0A1E3XAC7_9BACT|nr:MAG: hypothetical protein SCARUB_02304 [Candidatus Scalindua rubra]